MIYIGIDVGKNGGICAIRKEKEKAGSVLVVPYSDESLINICQTSLSHNEPIFCIVERVHAMPNQGTVSMFSFGQSYGFIQGVLNGLKIPYELVEPRKWKKEFSVTSDKNTSIEVAKRLYPDVCLKATDRCKKDHDGMAEALLLAEYAKRKF